MGGTAPLHESSRFHTVSTQCVKSDFLMSIGKASAQGRDHVVGDVKTCASTARARVAMHEENELAFDAEISVDRVRHSARTSRAGTT